MIFRRECSRAGCVGVVYIRTIRPLLTKMVGFMRFRNDEKGDRCGILIVLLVVSLIGGIVVGWIGSFFVFQGYFSIYWTQEPMGWILLILGIIIIVFGIFGIFAFCNLLFRKWRRNR